MNQRKQQLDEEFIDINSHDVGESLQSPHKCEQLCFKTFDCLKLRMALTQRTISTTTSTTTVSTILKTSSTVT